MLEEWLLKLWQLGGREGIAMSSLLHSDMVLVAEWLLLLALKAPSYAMAQDFQILILKMPFQELGCPCN